ncbi:hypothetical protein Tco_0349657 [Tanacetum coccineum]
MEQMTTLRDLVGQAIQKKEEEKRIAEEQAAKDRSWKIPICYDDDEDDTIAITPVLPIEEPDNSLSMGDEHLDTIPATESDEVIKSSVENLVPIPSESEGIPDKMCDVPLCENTTPLNALNEHSEIVVNSDDDNSSSDDDSPYGEDIEYVDASPPDVEIVSLEDDQSSLASGESVLYGLLLLFSRIPLISRIVKTLKYPQEFHILRQSAFWNISISKSIDKRFTFGTLHKRP